MLLFLSLALDSNGWVFVPKLFLTTKRSRYPNRANSIASIPNNRNNDITLENNNYDARENDEAKHNHNDEYNNNITELLATVSDAEALLACRAHLQRTNSLNEWTEGEQRKQRRRSIWEQAKQSDEVGFFWENPDELIYYDRSKRPMWLTESNMNEEREKVKMDTNSNIYQADHRAFTLESELLALDLQSADISTGYEVNVGKFDRELSFDIEKLDIPVDDSDGVDITAFSESFDYDHEAYLSHKRRSEAMRRQFQDPDWKDYWYQVRWGDHSVPSESEKRQQKLEKRVQSEVMKDFLSHPELCKLDEDIIAKAIQTYRQGNEKRSKSVREVFEKRKTPISDDINDAKVPRDILYRVDHVQQAEQRRLRGEIAKRAYRTRLENRRVRNQCTNGSSERKQPDDTVLNGTCDSPMAALERINLLLDINPSSIIANMTILNTVDEDLHILSQPQRLSGRKPLLRRVLKEVFGLRGKCVPTPGGVAFVTASSVSDLVAFVHHKLDEHRIDST